ncbi:hypothetical protein I4U23_027180 [Adineta vaga]|nr:hypothetical protein I4U23_027180 [Adineta vaga]
MRCGCGWVRVWVAVAVAVVYRYIDVNCSICSETSQYGRCASNSACGCFHMTGANNVGICGFLWTSCSTHDLCDSINNTCAKDDHICVHHPRCTSQPVCYPVSMIDPRICPITTMNTTTTNIIPIMREFTSTTTTATATITTTTTATMRICSCTYCSVSDDLIKTFRPVQLDEVNLIPEQLNVFPHGRHLTESHLYRVFCSKRRHSSSNNSCSTSIQQTSEQLYEQQNKPSSLHTTGNNKLHFIKGDRITTIGNLKLVWPIYGIDNFVYAGKRYDIFHTCTIDTGLFILYHAYKAHSDEFRNIFTCNSLDIYQIIWRTFQLVDTEGWTTARFYWLTEHNLLENRSSNGDYDLMDTMEAIVFQFIKPMQKYPVKSKCACPVCPKQVREYTNVDIS